MNFFSITDTQDVDLDAILGELCALESQYKEAANASPRQSSNGEFLCPKSSSNLDRNRNYGCKIDGNIFPTGSDISCYRRTTSNTSPQTGAGKLSYCNLY